MLSSCVLCLWKFLGWPLIFSEGRQLHAAAANGELWWIRLASAACGAEVDSQRRKAFALVSFPVCTLGADFQNSGWVRD